MFLADFQLWIPTLKCGHQFIAHQQELDWNGAQVCPRDKEGHSSDTAG